MFETETDANINAPAPDAFTKLELGVMVKFVAPEQATVCEIPWPN